MTYADITKTYGDAELVVINKKTGDKIAMPLGDGQLELIAETMQLYIDEPGDAFYMVADDVSHAVAVSKEGGFDSIFES